MRLHLFSVDHDAAHDFSWKTAITDNVEHVQSHMVLVNSCQVSFEGLAGSPENITSFLVFGEYFDPLGLSPPWRPSIENTHTYVVLFPEVNQEGRHDYKRTTDCISLGREHCYLVFFHIKTEYIDEFRTLLLHGCATVQSVEPGMLRYDLYQRLGDDGHFLVLEIAENEAAMREHNARRADGTMRAALSKMEATSRKLIPATGRYDLLFPSLGEVSWPRTAAKGDP